MNMSGFPRNSIDVEVCAAENENGNFVLQVINANSSKAQLQYFYQGKWWYIESLPNSLSTIVFDS